MNNLSDVQWNILTKAKNEIVEWSEKVHANIFAVYFIPSDDYSPTIPPENYSLGVYIFYETDNDIINNKNNGITEESKKIFQQVISRLDYQKYFGNKIVYMFDSNENVVKNYEGNYYYRLLG